MGFKADTSFLKFLTMGAVGVRATMRAMREEGFEPIELERYCTSNKIWSTKVKRLRLPDILCVRTGVRVEVRAKSDLKVRMSDAPTNPDRRWDVGLREDDLVAFVPCEVSDEGVTAVGRPVFFSVADLRSSIRSTKLGPPKSASEGAERDREWPCTVPSGDGRVIEVTNRAIVTVLASGRRQSYQLRGKRPYISPGDAFVGGASILAGVVARLAPLAALTSQRWDCRTALSAADPVDRYAAAKAIPLALDARHWGEEALAHAISEEPEDRVSLEMYASAAHLDAAMGLEGLSSFIWNRDRPDLRMEGVLILTELGTPRAAEELSRVASAPQFFGDEIRQAAVWGLGRAGARYSNHLINFIADEDEGVALHALGALDSDAPGDVLDRLVSLLVQEQPRIQAAASAALRIIGSNNALASLIRTARQRGDDDPWILGTIGRFPAPMVREALGGDPLLARVAPLLTMDPNENWLARSTVSGQLDFLLLQRL